MANRHLARSLAIQILYEWDFGGKKAEDLPHILAQTVADFAPGFEDEPFLQELVNGVVRSVAKLDAIITKAAPEWPVAQITLVDRNILRLGLWELLLGQKQEVPPKVAINEAIELAKTFGSHASGRFINGVLGTVYRETSSGLLGETNEMTREILGGAVVFRREGEKIFLALVKDIFGYWTFAKGHIESPETPEAAALRELREELGLNGKIISSLGTVSYPAKTADRVIERHVTYYLVQTNDKNIKLEATSGLKEAEWVLLDEIGNLRLYENQSHIIQRAQELLKQ